MKENIIPNPSELKKIQKENLTEEQIAEDKKREQAYEAGRGVGHKEIIGKEEVLNKVEALIKGVDEAIKKFQEVGFINEMYASSNTVSHDVMSFFEKDIVKRKEILDEVKKIQSEINTFLDSAGFKYVRLHDLERYIECIERYINRTRKDIGLEASLDGGVREYGLRFKTNLTTLESVVNALASSEDKK